MKFLLIILALFCCSISSMAQRDSIDVNKPQYSVRHGFVSDKQISEKEKADIYCQRHLYKAGEAIQKSTAFMYGSIASSLVSGVCCIIAGCSDNDGARTGLFIGGGVLAGVSIGCLFPALHFYDKAGRELRLSAGEITYKF